MRNKLLDILKGIGILLVVIGHCIQYGNGINYLSSNMFFHNFVFRVIYSFHMPLFVLVSGYLFYFTTNTKDSKTIIKSRINRCILPIFLWTIIGETIVSFEHGISPNYLQIISQSFFNFSFLWTIFLCTIVVLIVNKVYDDKISVYLIVLILSLFINIDLLNFTLYLLPYFIIGYEFNKNKEKILKFLTNKKQLLLFILLVFIYIMLFKYFTIDKYIYVNTYYIGNNINNLLINLYRFSIGLIGSLIIIMITNKLKVIIEKIKIFEIFGKNSMMIYIISYYLNVLLLCDNYTANYNFNYFNVVIETIIILLISNVLTALLRKNKFTKKYLIGE